jgi:hypothetical protein
MPNVKQPCTNRRIETSAAPIPPPSMVANFWSFDPEAG